MDPVTRVAIVTGASSGIGAACARQLASAGWSVGLVARRADVLAELVAEIKSNGGIAAAALADIAEREPTLRAIAKLEADLGPADLLIANAGVGTPTLLEPMNTPQIERMIRVNLLGVIYSIEGVLSGMLKRGRGHLVAISSLGAYKGLPGESAYCASKMAVNVYMEGLRIQLRRRGVAVTTICPGFVKTPMTDVNPFPMPWLMDADRAAALILRAIRRRRKVYNFPWQTSLLMKLTRWLPDWLVARIMHGYDENPPIDPRLGV
ncbi:MAG: SDR family NAD(P)-dependent oxidoreductase [Gemmataceae bacterium]